MMDGLWICLAWLMPRRLVYWTTIRLVTHNCPGNPTERRIVEALETWHK